MAINVTHMAIIAPGTLSLTPGGDIDQDFDFTLPDNTANRRGVLTYNLDAITPSNLTFTMSLNGTVVNTRRVDSTAFHGEHQVVSGFRAGDNRLSVRVTAGTGTAKFSDIVLFYDRGI